MRGRGISRRDPLGPSRRCLRCRHYIIGAARSLGLRWPLGRKRRRPPSPTWLGGGNSLPAARAPARLLLGFPLTLAIRAWPERPVSVFGSRDVWRCRLLSAMRITLRQCLVGALAFAWRFGSRGGGRSWPHLRGGWLIENSSALWKRALGCEMCGLRVAIGHLVPYATLAGVRPEGLNLPSTAPGLHARAR